MVTPYEVNCITLRQFLQRLAQLYEESLLIRSRPSFRDTHSRFRMACTFSAEGEIPAAEMVVAKGTQVNRT